MDSTMEQGSTKNLIKFYKRLSTYLTSTLS